MMRVSKNFWYHEFAPHGAGSSWLPQNKIMQLMVQKLAENLQIIRSLFPMSRFIVSSGVRTLVDYGRLKDLGYNPSQTSDHYFSQAIPLDAFGEKYKKFGSFYVFSVGAADIVPRGVSVMEVFRKAVSLNSRKEVSFGQIIYERGGINDVERIHFGNEPSLFYQPCVCEFFKRTKYMTSVDGGETYKVFK